MLMVLRLQCVSNHMQLSPESASLISSSWMLMPKSRDHWHSLGIGYIRVESSEMGLGGHPGHTLTGRSTFLVQGDKHLDQRARAFSSSAPFQVEAVIITADKRIKDLSHSAAVPPSATNQEQSFHFILCRWILVLCHSWLFNQGLRWQKGEIFSF